MNSSDNKIKTINDKINEFSRDLWGFEKVLVIGMIQRLGIFEYLEKKAKNKDEIKKNESISFTLEELSENLGLIPNYLEDLIHMAVEAQIFEIEDSGNRILRSAPYIFKSIIDTKDPMYIGCAIGTMYKMCIIQDEIFDNYRSGQTVNWEIFSENLRKHGQINLARMSVSIEKLFSKKFPDIQKRLKDGGCFLDIGCGFGYSLEKWANKYKKANFTGIDIDNNLIKSAQQLMKNNKYEDRCKISDSLLKELVKNNENHNKFDVIYLSHVLHEMQVDDTYRKNMMEDIYSLLKNDGILIVLESIVPDLCSPKHRYQRRGIWHKFHEISFISKFYNERSFKEFISSSLFTKVELIENQNAYFWAVQK
ncbi:MAG: class I SAM-dependent methyltransferase [archaeon]|nr:class I SAM-dependent methyltransferase [archaeon]